MRVICNYWHILGSPLDENWHNLSKSPSYDQGWSNIAFLIQYRYLSIFWYPIINKQLFRYRYRYSDILIILWSLTFIERFISHQRNLWHEMKISVLCENFCSDIRYLKILWYLPNTDTDNWTIPGYAVVHVWKINSLWGLKKCLENFTITITLFFGALLGFESPRKSLKPEFTSTGNWERAFFLINARKNRFNEISTL